MYCNETNEIVLFTLVSNRSELNIKLGEFKVDQNYFTK